MDMRGQQGFIQIPFIWLIAAIVSTLFVGGGIVLHKQDKLPFTASVATVFQGQEKADDTETEIESEQEQEDEDVSEVSLAQQEQAQNQDEHSSQGPDQEPDKKQTDNESLRLAQELEESKAEVERLKRESEEAKKLAEQRQEELLRQQEAQKVAEEERQEKLRKQEEEQASQKPVVDSTQKVSQSNVKQPSVIMPSQQIPIPTPLCTQDIWSCSDWLACSSSGSQTRSCNKTFECSSVVTQSPITSQSCTPPAPSCQADTWSCGDWSSCSTSGNQTRSCTKTFDCSSVNTPSPTRTQSCTPPAPIQQVPTYVMPDKPIIESFCDNKGNCACSSFAGSNSNCSASPKTTVHVGETLNFTIKVSGEETSGVLAFILPQEYDWVKEGGIKPWGTDLTYTKTFTTEDISALYLMYAYIKSSNDNYHRRSSGCNWTAYSCDDNVQLMYTVLP